MDSLGFYGAFYAVPEDEPPASNAWTAFSNLKTNYSNLSAILIECVNKSLDNYIELIIYFDKKVDYLKEIKLKSFIYKFYKLLIRILGFFLISKKILF